MKAIILAGGSGTRLWPLSRGDYPKQFLKINACESAEGCAFDRGSLIQQTIQRVLQTVPADDIVIVTNDAYKFHVRADLEQIASNGMENILLEPVKRNTAPAIALAVKYLTERKGCDSDEVVFVTPSDHVIEPDAQFAEYLKSADHIARKGFIVTFGIKPLYPETGYGYIKVRGENRKKGNSSQKDIYTVESFKEKPDRRTAEEYLRQGGYYWNSGMFAFTIGTLEEELNRHAPDIYERYQMEYDGMHSSFDTMPDISFDYAVMEQSTQVVTLPLDIYWNDVGSWDSMYKVFPKDDAKNVRIGDILSYETRNSLLMSDKRLIATIGINDMLVVETDDAILIANRGDAQKVKDIVNILNERSRKEAREHTTTYRPWGSYTVLEVGERYKIKRIVVYRGKKLSLQMHHHRSEHWVVIRGTAKVTIGDEVKLVHENESTYIPKSTLHRLENPGKVPLEMIEVQNGEYVGEDDIIRVDDEFGRGSE